MTDNKTHSKDDVLRMADWIDVQKNLCGSDEPDSNATFGRVAAMLRAYAEVVEVTDAPVDSACPMCGAPVKTWPDYSDGRGTDYEYVGPSISDLMVDRALQACWSGDVKWNAKDGDRRWVELCQRDMRAALTAALSTRGW